MPEQRGTLARNHGQLPNRVCVRQRAIGGGRAFKGTPQRAVRQTRLGLRSSNPKFDDKNKPADPEGRRRGRLTVRVYCRSRRRFFPDPDGVDRLRYSSSSLGACREDTTLSVGYEVKEGERNGRGEKATLSSCSSGRKRCSAPQHFSGAREIRSNRSGTKGDGVLNKGAGAADPFVKFQQLNECIIDSILHKVQRVERLTPRADRASPKSQTLTVSPSDSSVFSDLISLYGKKKSKSRFWKCSHQISEPVRS